MQNQFNKQHIVVHVSGGNRIVFDDWETFEGSVCYQNGMAHVFIDHKTYLLDRADGPTVESSDGVAQIWYRHGLKHRMDGPAYKVAHRTEWYHGGMLHREGGPAVEYHDGEKEWWNNGQMHREDGFAVEYATGGGEYWLNDEQVPPDEFISRRSNQVLVRIYHPMVPNVRFPSIDAYRNALSKDHDGRVFINTSLTGRVLIHSDDLPAVVFPTGEREWVCNGITHRTNGPAITNTNGDEYWYQNGVLHRVDGPASTCTIKENSETFTIYRWYRNGELFNASGAAELVVDKNGHVVSKIISQDGSLIIDIGDNNEGSDEELVEVLSADSAQASSLIIIHALDLDGKPVKIACNHAGFEQDIFSDHNKWFIDGTRYANNVLQNFNVNGPLVIHNGSNEPAIIYPDGTKEWIVNGFMHREGAPALEKSDGTKEWWVEGMLHRNGGPAIEHANGKKEFWMYGEKMENLPAEESKCWVKVKIKHQMQQGETIQALFFPTVEQYEKCCYNEGGVYKIRLSKWIDAKIHCEDGPAVEYGDGKVSYVIDGKLSDKTTIVKNRDSKVKENAHIVVRSEGRAPLHIANHDSLMSDILVKDQNGRMRFKDTGELLTNRVEPAMAYRDGTKTCIINGMVVDNLCLQISPGAGYEIEHIANWNYEKTLLKTSSARAWLSGPNSAPAWDIEVKFENNSSLNFSVPYQWLNHGFYDFHAVARETGMSGVDVFRSGKFIHKFLCTLFEYGPQSLEELAIVSEEYRQQYNEMMYKALDACVEITDEPEETSGFGLPLACLAIAGIASLAATNKKTRKKEKDTHKKESRAAIVNTKVIEEEAVVVAG